jgi:anti-sigma regulatory factor (Ser/Thr protein kinase)
VVHLPCTPASVGVARRAVAAELRSAGVFDAAVSDAVLVVSELMSNAILHAYPLPGELLKLRWAMNGGSVEVAVSDGGGATMPHAGRPSLSSLGGRGLNIVAHLSLSWGVRSDEVGLTVWAILDAPRREGASPTAGTAQELARADGRGAARAGGRGAAVSAEA